MPAALALSIHSSEADGCVHIYHTLTIKWDRARLGNATRTAMVESGVLLQPCLVQGCTWPRDKVKPEGWCPTKVAVGQRLDGESRDMALGALLLPNLSFLICKMSAKILVQHLLKSPDENCSWRAR